MGGFLEVRGGGYTTERTYVPIRSSTGVGYRRFTPRDLSRQIGGQNKERSDVVAAHGDLLRAISGGRSGRQRGPWAPLLR